MAPESRRFREAPVPNLSFVHNQKSLPDYPRI